MVGKYSHSALSAKWTCIASSLPQEGSVLLCPCKKVVFTLSLTLSQGSPCRDDTRWIASSRKYVGTSLGDACGMSHAKILCNTRVYQTRKYPDLDGFEKGGMKFLGMARLVRVKAAWP